MSVHAPLGATPQSGAFDLTTHAPGAHSSAPAVRDAARRLRLGQAALAGLLLSGLVISIAAAGTDTLLPESVRPVPSWLAGAFGSTGIDLHVAGAIGALALMFVCYVVAVRAAETLSPRMVLATIAALHALVLLAPPLLSTDVFSYQAYARMWSLYGSNPYLHGPHVMALDPLYPFIGAKWVSTPTVYGPLFTVLSYLLGPLSIAASALTYKAIAALSSLAVIAVVWNAARLRGLDPVKAVALVGLNPLVLVYGVGGGHNDLLMLAITTAGVYALLAYRQRAAGATFALATGIKLTAALLLPFALASGGGGGLGSRSRRREMLAAAGVTGALIATLGFAAFGAGPLHLFGTLHQIQNEGDWKSIPGFISTRMGLGDVGHITGLLLGLLFVAVTVWLVLRVWRGELDWIDGAAWSTLAMICTASSLLPWYVAWLLPLVALCTTRRLWTLALVITGVVQGIQLLGYVPHANTLLGL